MSRFAYRTEFSEITPALVEPIKQFAWDAERIQVAIDGSGKVVVDFGDMLSGASIGQLAGILGCRIARVAMVAPVKWLTIHAFVPDH